MTYRGTIRNGLVHLDPEADLPDGTKVRVEPLDSDEDHSTVFQKLARLAGRAKGLPADMARNHDHYLHGTSPE